MISAIQLPSLVQRNLIYLPRILMLCTRSIDWCEFSTVGMEFVWRPVNGAKPSTPIPGAPPKLVAPPPPKPDYGHQIARLHLMGKAEVTAKPANLQIEEDAPDTSLNLTLSGVLALGLGDGYAIIERSIQKT